MCRLFRVKSKFLDDMNISVCPRPDLSNRDVVAMVLPAPIVTPNEIRNLRVSVFSRERIARSYQIQKIVAAAGLKQRGLTKGLHECKADRAG
jgi:hypothetical protein